MSTFVSSVSIWTPKMCPKARLKGTKDAKNPDIGQTSDEHHFLNVFHTKARRGNNFIGCFLGLKEDTSNKDTNHN